MKSRAQKAAFKAVKEERDYQDRRWAGSPSGGHHATGAYLAFLQYYVTRALVAVTKDDVNDMQDCVRKIAALAVACMEDNGTKRRKQ